MTEHDDYLKWLHSLKVGDEVCIITDDFGRDKKNITKVAIITKTGRIKTEFMPDAQFIEGSYRVSKWRADTLIPVTQEIRDEIKYERRLRIIEKADFKKLSPQAINSIYEIVKKERGEK